MKGSAEHMRRSSAVITSILGAASLLLAASVGITYKNVFYMSDERKSRRWKLPRGEQFEKDYDRMNELIAAAEAVPFEEVGIRSRDGLKLYGRYYHIADGAPLMLLFHGYHGFALRDFAGAHKIARENGLNMLVVDERAHGRSEGHTIAFGVKERYDILDWIDYARGRFGSGTPFVLSGISMGGAAVCMAAGLDLPENVKGIIADCPFSSPKAIIKRVCAERGYQPDIMWAIAWLTERILGRVDLTSATAVDAVKRAKVPMLFIHGEDDRFVPCSMSREIFGACASKKRIETFPGAGHGVSYLSDPERYTRAVLKFVKTVTESQE